MELRTRRVNNVFILELEGRFDIHTAPSARDLIREATEEEPAFVVVNMAAVHFVDSIALSVLVEGMKRSHKVNGDLRLCNLQQPVRMIFELTRLDKAFEIFAREEEAVQAFGA